MRIMAEMEGSVLLRRPTLTLKLIRHFEWRGNQNKSEMGLRRSNEARLLLQCGPRSTHRAMQGGAGIFPERELPQAQMPSFFRVRC